MSSLRLTSLPKMICVQFAEGALQATNVTVREGLQDQRVQNFRRGVNKVRSCSIDLISTNYFTGYAAADPEDWSFKDTVIVTISLNKGTLYFTEHSVNFCHSSSLISTKSPDSIVKEYICRSGNNLMASFSASFGDCVK